MHDPLAPVNWVQKYEDGRHWKTKRKKKKVLYISVTMIVAQMMRRWVRSIVSRSNMTAMEALMAMLDRT